MFEPVPLLRYADAGFQPDKLQHCLLRIQLSDEELLIAVFDPVLHRFPLVEKYTVRAGYSGLQTHQAAARILRSHSLVRQDFKSREMIWVSPKYTLVPEALFETNSARDLLALVHPLNDSDIIQNDVLNIQGIRVVYAIPDVWKPLLQELGADSIEHHYLYHLLQKVTSENVKSDGVFCHVQDFRMDIIVLKDHRLVLSNSFKFQTPDDFIYFILLAYDRYHFNRDEVILHLCGEIDAGSALYSSAFKYIRELHFLNRPKEPVVAPPADGTTKLQDHFYLNLLHPANENY